MIDTKRLAYFIRVAEDGSLSKAATNLHIAQPALSRQIHILEDYLGFALFTRTSRGMQLTREGKWLRDAVAGPLRDIDLAAQNLRMFLSRADWDIGIGLHSGISQAMAPSLVGCLQSDFQEIKFRLLEGPVDSQIDWLKQGTIDFALVDQPVIDEQLFDRQLASEPLVLISASAIEEEQGRTIGFRHAMQLPLVLPSQHQGVRKAVDGAAKKVRRIPSIRFEADSLPLITSLVASGQMHGLLPASLALRLEKDHGFHVAMLKDPAVTVGIHLVSRSYGDVADGGAITKLDRAIQELVMDMTRCSWQL